MRMGVLRIISIPAHARHITSAYMAVTSKAEFPLAIPSIIKKFTSQTQACKKATCPAELAGAHEPNALLAKSKNPVAGE